MKSIDFLERDFCAIAIEMFTKVTLDTYVMTYSADTYFSVSEEDHEFINKFKKVNGEAYRYLNCIQDIQPSSIEDVDRKDIILRRIGNIETITSNIRKEIDLLDGVDIEISPFLTPLDQYRRWALSATSTPTEECEPSTGNKRARRNPFVMNKTPAELLALHKKDPTTWTLRTLADKYYPYDPKNTRSAKKSWICRLLRKAHE